MQALSFFAERCVALMHGGEEIKVVIVVDDVLFVRVIAVLNIIHFRGLQLEGSVQN